MLGFYFYRVKMPLEIINYDNKPRLLSLGKRFPWPDAMPCHMWRWQQRWTPEKFVRIRRDEEWWNWRHICCRGAAGLRVSAGLSKVTSDNRASAYWPCHRRSVINSCTEHRTHDVPPERGGGTCNATLMNCNRPLEQLGDVCILCFCAAYLSKIFMF